MQIIVDIRKYVLNLLSNYVKPKGWPELEGRNYLFRCPCKAATDSNYSRLVHILFSFFEAILKARTSKNRSIITIIR